MKKIILIFAVLFLPVMVFALSLEKVMKLEGETKDVRSVAFSPDGSNIASGGGNNRLKVWDAATGKILLDIDAHKEKITSVRYTPDGKAIITGSEDDFIKFWDAKTGKLIKEIDTDWNVYGIDVYHNGKFFAIAGEFKTNVQIYSFPAGVTVKTMEEGSKDTVAFSKTGKYLAGVDNSYGSVNIWQVVDGKIFKKHDTGCTGKGLDFSRDKKYLGVCGYKDFGKDTVVSKGYVEFLDTENFNSVAVAWMSNHPNIKLNFIKFSPDSSFFVTGDTKGTLSAHVFDGKGFKTVWSMDMAHELAFFAGTPAILDAAFSPDGKYLVTGSDNGNIDLILWRIKE